MQPELKVPSPGPGQVLLSVKYLSLDPYMRGRMDDRKSYAPPTPIGDVMPGETVAEVIASNNPGYAVGDIVASRTAIVDAVATTRCGDFMMPNSAACLIVVMASEPPLRRPMTLAPDAAAVLHPANPATRLGSFSRTTP